MSTHGPRRTAGYQFPRTDATSLRRGDAILSERGLGGAWNATLELVPMLGGKPELFDVSLVWSRAGVSSGALTCLVQGEARARQAFAATVAHFSSTGNPPAAIPVPSDTPMF